MSNDCVGLPINAYASYRLRITPSLSQTLENNDE